MRPQPGNEAKRIPGPRKMAHRAVNAIAHRVPNISQETVPESGQLNSMIELEVGRLGVDKPLYLRQSLWYTPAYDEARSHVHFGAMSCDEFG